MSKPAGRRAPGRSAADLQGVIERFLRTSKKPALLEPGEEIVELREDNFVLGQHQSTLRLQTWDQRRNLVRQVVDIREEGGGRLELVVERFARKQGTLFLLDLARPTTRDWQSRGARLVFRERFRHFLSREFPQWRVASISAEQDLEHSLSPAYPRAMLRRGGSILAAIAAPPETLDPDGVLSFGLIWLDYLRRRETKSTVEGLLLFLPEEKERTTCLCVPFLNHAAARYEIFAYSKQDFVTRLDPRNFANLDTRLDVCQRAAHADRAMVARITAIDGVEQIEKGNGEISLRVRGLEFARVSSKGITFGLGCLKSLRPEQFPAVERLARALVGLRAIGANRQSAMYLRNPEAWLESQVRAKIDVVDASVMRTPIYGQVPAFAGGERGVIDLLAVERSGRLAVLELKASADLHLPLQGLHYWMRVRWHLERGEFSERGYFPGVSLLSKAPRLLLVAPALEFHPTTETILKYFSPSIEVERIGLNMDWRTRLEVMFRLHGSQRPD